MRELAFWFIIIIFSIDPQSYLFLLIGFYFFYFRFSRADSLFSTLQEMESFFFCVDGI